MFRFVAVSMCLRFEISVYHAVTSSQQVGILSYNGRLHTNFCCDAQFASENGASQLRQHMIAELTETCEALGLDESSALKDVAVCSTALDSGAKSWRD